MTFLATFAAFSAMLLVTWLATLRSKRQHECSCSRSERLLSNFERTHPRSGRVRPAPECGSVVLIPLDSVTIRKM